MGRAYRNNYAASIRKPVHLHDEYNAIKIIYNHLELQLGRVPTSQEVTYLFNKTRKKKWSVEKVENLMLAFATPTSLSLSFDPDDPKSRTLEQNLTDLYAEDVGKAAETAMLHAQLQKAIARLPERQRTAILMRYGLAPYKKEYEFSDIAKKLGTSKDVARSTLTKGLRKMAQQSQSLKRWLDSDCDPP